MRSQSGRIYFLGAVWGAGFGAGFAAGLVAGAELSRACDAGVAPPCTPNVPPVPLSTSVSVVEASLVLRPPASAPNAPAYGIPPNTPPTPRVSFWLNVIIGLSE